jgi:hypothetical protein
MKTMEAYSRKAQIPDAGSMGISPLRARTAKKLTAPASKCLAYRQTYIHIGSFRPLVKRKYGFQVKIINNWLMMTPVRMP